MLLPVRSLTLLIAVGDCFALNTFLQWMISNEVSYHIRDMVRVHLIQVLIIYVGIGKVKAVA